MKTRFNRRLEKDKTPSRTVVERYREAIQDIGEKGQDDEDADTGLALVHYRGGKEELRLGLEYSRSADPLDRTVGARILAQLGWDDQTYLQESVEVLIKLLDDVDSDVVSAAAAAFAHRSDDRAVPHLIRHATRKESSIRYGVACGLVGNDSPEAIAALIEFTRDEDREVRDYAVFGLGSQTECDTSEIREALFSALNDADSEIRGEALVGLAERRDIRVKDAILEEWKTDEISILSIEAAEVLGDPEFLPFLRGFVDLMDLAEDAHFSDQLSAAIAACEAN